MKRRETWALLGAIAAGGVLTARAQARPIGAMTVHLLRAPGRVLDLGYADVDGDGREDLVVAHLNGDGAEKDARGASRRYLSVWRQGGPEARWGEAPSATRPVGEDAVAFATGDFDPAPGGEVALLGARAVTVLRKGAGGLLSDEAVVTTCSGFFDYPAVGGLPRWDLAQDLGGRAAAPPGGAKGAPGPHDLLVPLKDGYLVLRNEPGKGLVPKGPLKVPSGERFGPALESKFLNRFLTYISTLPRVMAVDLDADGRKDLVVYRKKGLARFLQASDGTFPTTPTIEKPLAVVEDASKKKAKEGGDPKNASQAFSNVRVQLADLDGDGFADLVVTKTVGEIGVFETLRTQFLIWRGNKDGWNEASPDRIINQKGISNDPVLVDWDGDGKLDLIVSALRMDHFTNLKRAITKSVTISYSIYLQGKEGFSEEPEYTRDVSVDLEALERRTGSASAQFDANVNGDRWKDMIVRTERGRLRIIPGATESGLFSGSRPTFLEDEAVEVEVPSNCDLEVRDLYRDGKGDALVLSNVSLDHPERASLRIVEARR